MCASRTPIPFANDSPIDSLPPFPYNTKDSPAAVFPRGGDRMKIYEALSLMIAFGTLIAIIISSVVMIVK